LIFLYFDDFEAAAPITYKYIMIKFFLDEEFSTVCRANASHRFSAYIATTSKYIRNESRYTLQFPARLLVFLSAAMRHPSRKCDKGHLISVICSSHMMNCYIWATVIHGKIKAAANSEMQRKQEWQGFDQIGWIFDQISNRVRMLLTKDNIFARCARAFNLGEISFISM